MGRFTAYIIIATVWLTSLVVVGAYAGWTFVAVKNVGVAAVADPALKGVSHELLARFVGGAVTRAPFEIVGFASLIAPAVLALFVGTGFGRASKPSVLATGVVSASLLAAVVSIRASVTLAEASGTYWDAVKGRDTSAIESAKATLDSAHGRAQSYYLTMTGLAALALATGAFALARCAASQASDARAALR